MDCRHPVAWIRRLESQFLKSYRLPIALSFVGLFIQSILILPIPLLQGWVLDRLLARPVGSAATAAASRAIVLGLLATVACHMGRLAMASNPTLVRCCDPISAAHTPPGRLAPAVDAASRRRPPG